MASTILVELKEDIKQLEKLFLKKTNDTSCFRIITASINELVCEFIDVNKKKYRINANITENYPQSPPVWFSESEDSIIIEIIEKINTTTDENNKIVNQVKLLITDLCHSKKTPLPDLSHLNNSAISSQNNDSGHVSTNNSDNENDMDMDTEVESNNLGEDESVSGEVKKEIDGISRDNWELLQKVKNSQRQDYLKGINYGSPMANDRLMKELRDIFKSDNYKNGIYTVELKNDSLYDWNVYLHKVDPDSALFEDLKIYKEKEQKDYILLNFIFKDNFPFEPPFVRVVCPIIKGGYVLTGGAICMELLTKQGWSSAYCIESVILQISATLVKGKARIEFDKKPHLYSLSSAQVAFKSLSQMHEKNGWHTPNPNDG
ncbi:unnamed protein product [Brachionus calyciflorus]|uniref:UBC core domain-containing protein n=1 Tax=Brachionus calyciflorus TaxID=104777 RepID=A0A813QXK0_9BILA|nr:unnamed protein product [Brachionus calyciflorus]